MAWIETVPEDEASGDLARQYAAARKRAGKVFQVVKVHSLRPDVMRTFMELYIKLMHAPSGLTRSCQRSRRQSARASSSSRQSGCAPRVSVR